MKLPQDPMMLFSTINMYLRDKYSSLDELCLAEDIDQQQLCDTLAAIGFEYNRDLNKFW